MNNLVKKVILDVASGARIGLIKKLIQQVSTKTKLASITIA